MCNTHTQLNYECVAQEAPAPTHSRLRRPVAVECHSQSIKIPHTHTLTRVLQQWPSNYSHVKCILVHGRPRIVWHAEHNTHHISASTGSPTPPSFGTKKGRPRALMTAPSARDSANNMKRGRECSSARGNARILWHRMLQWCPRVCCNFATQYPH